MLYVIRKVHARAQASGEDLYVGKLGANKAFRSSATWGREARAQGAWRDHDTHSSVEEYTKSTSSPLAFTWQWRNAYGSNGTRKENAMDGECESETDYYTD